MGKAKRRKQLLGDKYGKESSHKISSSSIYSALRKWSKEGDDTHRTKLLTQLHLSALSEEIKDKEGVFTLNNEANNDNKWTILFIPIEQLADDLAEKIAHLNLQENKVFLINEPGFRVMWHFPNSILTKLPHAVA